MTNRSLCETDELSFLGLVKYFFKYRLLISICAILGGIVGVGLYMATPKQYRISSAYHVNIYPASVRNLCTSISAGGSLSKFIDCLDQQIVGQIEALSAEHWIFEGSIVTKKTSHPLSAFVYEDSLKEIETQYNQLIFQDSQTDLEIISAEMDPRVLATDAISGAFLAAKRNLKMINQGRSAITFQPVNVTKTSRNVFVLAFAATLLGAFIGMLYSLGVGFASKHI